MKGSVLGSEGKPRKNLALPQAPPHKKSKSSGGVCACLHSPALETQDTGPPPINPEVTGAKISLPKK